MMASFVCNRTTDLSFCPFPDHEKNHDRDKAEVSLEKDTGGVDPRTTKIRVVQEARRRVAEQIEYLLGRVVQVTMADAETDRPSDLEEQRPQSPQESEDATAAVDTDADDEHADDEQFVAIELTSTSASQAESDRERCLEEEEEELCVMKLPASECGPDSDPHLIRASANPGQEAALNTGRRRVLHHPILSPLTKLPWGRLATAAGSCDLLFNCKYTMRQVEDEVKQEQHRIENGDEEAAYEGQSSDRKDGYVSVNLGLVDQETGDPLPFFGLQEHEAADIEENNTPHPATDARQESQHQPETKEAHNPVADAVNMMVYKGLIGE